MCERFGDGSDGVFFVLIVAGKNWFCQPKVMTSLFITPDVERDDGGVIFQRENGGAFYRKCVATEERYLDSITSGIRNLVYRNNKEPPFS